MIAKGDALDLILAERNKFDLIVTNPHHARGGAGEDHVISASVAAVLREAAARLKRGRFMGVMCASSWRSMSHMVESVRGLVAPVRVGTWCRPGWRTGATTTGWAWASVTVIMFHKGNPDDVFESCPMLDTITAPAIENGLRAELPPEVADWMVTPFAVEGGRFLDPFAGSGATVRAAERSGMIAIGYDQKPVDEAA